MALTNKKRTTTNYSIESYLYQSSKRVHSFIAYRFSFDMQVILRVTLSLKLSHKKTGMDVIFRSVSFVFPSTQLRSVCATDSKTWGFLCSTSLVKVTGFYTEDEPKHVCYPMSSRVSSTEATQKKPHSKIATILILFCVHSNKPFLPLSR